MKELLISMNLEGVVKVFETGFVKAILIVLIALIVSRIVKGFIKKVINKMPDDTRRAETIMKIFYAVDYMIVDSLAISDKEIPITDCPHDVLAFTEALDSYIKLVKIKLDYLNEITEFNNKQRKASL